MICPSCRKPQSDPRLVSCEFCKVPFVEHTNAPIHLSDENIRLIVTSILRAPRFWLAVSAGILALGYAVFSFIDWATGKSAKDVIDQVARDASNHVTRAYSAVTNNLAAELQSPRINTIINEVVESRALQRIDDTADNIISDKIRSEITPRLSTADSKVESLDTTIQEARSTLDEVKQQSEFITTLVAAENDDRHALDRLASWAEDPSHPMSQLARQAWLKIRIYYVGDEIKPTITFTWPSGIDPSHDSMDVLRAFYKTLPTDFHPVAVQQIWNNTNISKQLRMEFLIDVMRNDASINAVDYARKFFWKSTDLDQGDLKVKPLVLDPLYTWWETNKTTIKE